MLASLLSTMSRLSYDGRGVQRFLALCGFRVSLGLVVWDCGFEDLMVQGSGFGAWGLGKFGALRPYGLSKFCWRRQGWMKVAIAQVGSLREHRDEP